MVLCDINELFFPQKVRLYVIVASHKSSNNCMFSLPTILIIHPSYVLHLFPFELLKHLEDFISILPFRYLQQIHYGPSAIVLCQHITTGC